MHIEVMTPAQAVEQACWALTNVGKFASPRGLLTRELLSPTLVVHEPWHLPMDLAGRGLRDRIGALEALQLVGQTATPERMPKAFGKFMDAGILRGAYGPRVYGQLERVVDLLTSDPDSRQAVITIYDGRQDLAGKSKDVPCTLTLQYFVRDEAVHARTSMRSNDVWLGLPYDLVQFIALQGAVARALGLPMGQYHHSVGSLHLYSDNFGAAGSVKASSTQHLGRPQKWLWSGWSIGEISSMARRLLAGEVLQTEMAGLTSFEQWLGTSVAKAA